MLKNTIKSHLQKNKLFKHILILSSGAVLGQGITFLAYPFLTRLYTPEDFGVVSVYTSILSILLGITSMRYEIAIPLPNDDDTAAEVLCLSICIVFIIAAIVGIFIWLEGDRLISWTNATSLKPYLWLLTLSVLGIGISQAFNYWAIRISAFKLMARIRINQSITQVGTNIVLGIFGLTPLGLLLGYLFGNIVGSGSLIVLAWKKNRKALCNVSITGVGKVAVKYWRFPIFSSGSAILNYAGLYLPQILLAVFYGPVVAGWFSLGQKVIGAPLTIIGNAVNNAYYGEASRVLRENPKNLKSLYYNTSKRLLIPGILILVFSMFSRWFFTFLFGSNWSEAGVYVQVLGPMFLIQIVVVPLSHTLNLLEKQLWLLGWDIFRFVVVISTMLLVFRLGGSPMLSIITFSASTSLAYLLLIVLNIYGLRTNFKGL